MDARKGYWQADTHPMGRPGQSAVPAGEHKSACQAFPGSGALCDGE